MSLEEICQKYSISVSTEKPTDSQGLSETEAKSRLEKYGFNQLTPPKKYHPILVYLYYVSGIFNLMLIVAGVVSYILYGINPSDNSSLVTVVEMTLVVYRWDFNWCCVLKWFY